MRRTCIRLLVVVLALSACGRNPAPIIDDVARQGDDILNILRRSGDDVVLHTDEATLRARIERNLQSLDNNSVPAQTAPDAVSRLAARQLVDDVQARLAELATFDNFSTASGVLTEAHCAGIQQHLATGAAPTNLDYAIYLAIAAARSQIPTDEARAIVGHAQNMMRLGQAVHARLAMNEGQRQAYLLTMCSSQ
jgi:hypothetical protein